MIRDNAVNALFKIPKNPILSLTNLIQHSLARHRLYCQQTHCLNIGFRKTRGALYNPRGISHILANFLRCKQI